MAISISFIIPHKGRIDLLQKTIQSIECQDFDLDTIEIIVVTQDEDPNAVGRCFDKYQNVTILARPTSDSISALRNHGVEHCHSSRYLAFLDSDIAISESWSRTLIEDLEEKPDRVIVCAYQNSLENSNPIEEIRSALSRSCMGSSVNAMSGQNLFLKVSSFERIRGFPESLKTCEDTYFTSSAAEMGELYVSPRTSYIHLGEDQDYRQLFNKEIWRARSNLASLLGRPVTFREYPSIIFPIVIMIGLVATPILFLIDQTSLAVVAMNVSLTPILLYSVRLWLSASRQNTKITDIFRFYTTYFIGRAIGSTLGVLRQ